MKKPMKTNTNEDEKFMRRPIISELKKTFSGSNTREDANLKTNPFISIYWPIESLRQKKQLGKRYTSYENDLYTMCLKNATICLEYQRTDLFRAWNILGCSLKDLDKNVSKLKEWNSTPLGKITFFNLTSNFIM